MSGGSENGVFEHMVDVVGWTSRTLADEVVALENGWCVRTATLPQVWSLNHLALRHIPDPRTCLALADQLQSDLTFRHLHIGGGSSSLEEDKFVREGWKVDREVYMVLARRPQTPDSSDVVELTPDQVTSLMEEWIVEDHPGISRESSAQIEEASRREGRLWDESAFGIVDRDGRPVAMTKLRIRRGVAWVEDVFTSARARGQGYARRLVSHAMVLAADSDSSFAFIVADDNDWPKDLYASLGFQPVGLTWTLHREIATRRS
jgi:GNAT superfamily N-acetyltransferase